MLRHIGTLYNNKQNTANNYILVNFIHYLLINKTHIRIYFDSKVSKII